MLSTRLATQLSQFSKSDSSEIKMDILYKICFADTLDIPINIIKLSEWYQTNYKLNINTYLVEMEHEFFVKKTMETDLL
ncbi:hypothetical protein FM106_13965 [Brachybacterium faecium]|nr:hypothetical protein FM106_13965 [Brachybacterium faecium]